MIVDDWGANPREWLWAQNNAELTKFEFEGPTGVLVLVILDADFIFCETKREFIILRDPWPEGFACPVKNLNY